MNGIFTTMTTTTDYSGLDGIGQVVTKVVSWFGDTIGIFNDHPVMWVPVGFGIVGAGIGLVRRATRIGGGRRK